MDNLEKYKERFAKSTMRVFEYAIEESRRRVQNHISLEHIIDALAMKEMDLFNVILAKTGVELGALRALFKTRIDSIPQNKGTDIYIAPGVIDLFRHARKAARAANRERIIVADLFIALVQGEQKMLLDIMLAFGANLEVMLENAKHIYEAYDQAATSAAKTWLDELDAGDPNDIWSQAHPLFKFFWSDTRWLSFQNIKVYFGKVISRNLQSIAYSETMAGIPDGEYYTIRYQTSFENKKAGIEEIFLMRDEAEWKIIGYVVA
jgi:ATP-dependent Clp protease ATP-binding subunit ClpA